MVIPRTSLDGLELVRTTSTVLMRSPYQQSARRPIEATPHQSDQTAGDGRRPKPVEPVHDPAMTGNKTTGIFRAEPPFHPGFRTNRQIAPGLKVRMQSQGSQAVLDDPKSRATSSAAIMAPAVPAIAPDQVFFGLTAGISFGPPRLGRQNNRKHPSSTRWRTGARSRQNHMRRRDVKEIGASSSAPAYPRPSVTHNLRVGGEKIAAASAPSPNMSSAEMGRSTHTRKPAAAIAPAHDRNSGRCDLPATSSSHSHKTASAATPQKSMKGQLP